MVLPGVYTKGVYFLREVAYYGVKRGFMDWFSVDKAGLAKLLDKRGKAFIVFELVQNCWDTNAKEVDISIVPVENAPYATIEVVDDDKDGFKNLAHAFTLFAESDKKADPTKRGRFNLGEKLVLALCDRAEILTTTGSIVFDSSGRRSSRSHIVKGSIFRGTVRMTRGELLEVRQSVRMLLPPQGVVTRFNGDPLRVRPPIAQKEFTLPTEISDAEGFLRRSQRKTLVSVHEVESEETPMLYEMGIPVVELSGGERWHVNVHQKVPLNVDRDNVTPSYLQALRVALAELIQDRLTKEDTSQVWVNAATEDERVEPEVVRRVLDERFGKKRAVFDPSDLEANKALMHEGYTIIPGGALSKGQWGHVRERNLALPSGKIKPSGVQHDPNGRPENVIPESSYSPGQRMFVEYVAALGERLLAKHLLVRLVSEIGEPHSAWYSSGTVTFNVGRLGKAWFENGIQDAHHRLIIHEFAHDKVRDHFTKEFSDEVGRVGVKLAREMFLDPEFFRYSGYKP